MPRDSKQYPDMYYYRTCTGDYTHRTNLGSEYQGLRDALREGMPEP